MYSVQKKERIFIFIFCTIQNQKFKFQNQKPKTTFKLQPVQRPMKTGCYGAMGRGKTPKRFLLLLLFLILLRLRVAARARRCKTTSRMLQEALRSRLKKRFSVAHCVDRHLRRP